MKEREIERNPSVTQNTKNKNCTKKLNFAFAIFLKLPMSVRCSNVRYNFGNPYVGLRG